MIEPNARDAHELEHMTQVDIHPWGPTEPDETDLLRSRFGVGTSLFALRVGSLAPNQAASMIHQARDFIGSYGRPNKFTLDYASRHGKAFETAPWCDMFVTYVARLTKSTAAIPKGDRAWTVQHAGDFEQLHELYLGERVSVQEHASPGDVVFFDWGGSDTIDKVDHVGIVVTNLGDGRCVTIEGNTGSNEVRLRVRGSDVIDCFGRPHYASSQPDTHGDRWPYAAGTLMRRGWIHSAGVLKVQTRLNTLGYRPRLAQDGDYGAKTEVAVIWFQKRHSLMADGVVGPITWAALFPGA
jgi:hypothetical protein